MDLIGEYPIRRFDAGRWTSAADKVVTEARIELDLNDGQLRLAVAALPRDLEALAVGLLLSEGALRRVEDLASVQFVPSEGRVAVRGSFSADALAALGRGPTGKAMASAVGSAPEPTPMLTARELLRLIGQFRAKGALWKLTGGVHACALAGRDGILHVAEDVGRHNAFDKVVGMAALGGLALAGKLVLTTGRLSAEIVSKAVTCGVPMLVSRSAVTSLAVELASRSDVTLVGFARGNRMNVYTCRQRIAPAGPSRSGATP